MPRISDASGRPAGIIFDVQRFSLHDGPGIRTTVFFKGCPMRCDWCSNPESQRPEPEFMFSPERCIGCVSCVGACPIGTPYSTEGFRPEKCVSCLSCTDICPTEALVRKGTPRTADDLLREVLRDRLVFENSGGGVTVSGGEPLMQPDFLEDFLKRLKENGIHTAMESTFYAPWETAERVLPFLDHIFCDIKHTDPEIHRLRTGVSCKPVLENAKRLARTGRSVTFRIPVIPGFNTGEEAAEGFSRFFRETGNVPVELLPYHIYGERKYHLLRREYPGENIPAEGARELAEGLAEMLRAGGHTVSVSD